MVLIHVYILIKVIVCTALTQLSGKEQFINSSFKLVDGKKCTFLFTFDSFYSSYLTRVKRT